jgi:hypothetical protein
MSLAMGNRKTPREVLFIVVIPYKYFEKFSCEIYEKKFDSVQS